MISIPQEIQTTYGILLVKKNVPLQQHIIKG